MTDLVEKLKTEHVENLTSRVGCRSVNWVATTRLPTSIVRTAAPLNTTQLNSGVSSLLAVSGFIKRNISHRPLVSVQLCCFAFHFPPAGTLNPTWFCPDLISMCADRCWDIHRRSCLAVCLLNVRCGRVPYWMKPSCVLLAVCLWSVKCWIFCRRCCCRRYCCHCILTATRWIDLYARACGRVTDAPVRLRDGPTELIWAGIWRQVRPLRADVVRCAADGWTWRPANQRTGLASRSCMDSVSFIAVR